MKKTTLNEHATPTQLIKIAKPRHLVSVTIFRCCTWLVRRGLTHAEERKVRTGTYIEFVLLQDFCIRGSDVFNQ